MQLSDVVIVYFVIGAVMVGGGALSLSDAGMANFFVEENSEGDLQPTGNATGEIDQTSGAISTVVQLAVGGIVLVWELAIGLFAYLHWPITTMQQHNAPPMATLLIGGGFQTAFYMAVIGILWRAT